MKPNRSNTNATSGRAVGRALLVAALALTATGCVSRAAMQRMQDQLDYLEASQHRMERDVIRIDSLTTESTTESRRTRAEVATSLEEFQGEARTMRESIDELRRTMERRPPQIVYRAPAPADTVPGEITGATGDAVEPPPDIDPSQLYENAFLDVRKGNYELAIDQFRDILTFFGDTEYAPNARYWIGECWYSLAGAARGEDQEARYDSAIVEFEYLISNYSESDRVPTALYKLGRCYEELNRPRRACRYYNQVIADYPKSLEAKPAQGRFEALGCEEG
ncbi:MAG TPA: tol-pal system protein YbgF [Acidobacteriota bacterium]|nr:tol-pal system protein YbgF [Acidobacteriota bacterium]